MMNGQACDGTQDGPRPTTLNRISVALEHFRNCKLRLLLIPNRSGHNLGR